VATVLYALSAELKISGLGGDRTEPIERFYLDYLRTSLKPGEMVTEVFVPNPQPESGAAFLNLVRTHADIAKMTVAVVVVLQNGVCREAKIAIGAAAPTVIRATKAEGMLTGGKLHQRAINEAAETAAEETRPITDLRSTARYRKETGNVLVRRALEKASEEARRGVQ
jgi:CO/xanthine dehydrogenase FAD-binding subunit